MKKASSTREYWWESACSTKTTNLTWFSMLNVVCRPISAPEFTKRSFMLILPKRKWTISVHFLNTTNHGNCVLTTWFYLILSRYAMMISISFSRTSWRRALCYSSVIDKSMICFQLSLTVRLLHMGQMRSRLGYTQRVLWYQYSISVHTLRPSATFQIKKRKFTLFSELSTASICVTCTHCRHIHKA